MLVQPQLGIMDIRISTLLSEGDVHRSALSEACCVQAALDTGAALGVVVLAFRPLNACAQVFTV